MATAMKRMIDTLTTRVTMLLALLIQTALVGGAERPNIVYIMADELGYYELSCMGHPHIQTPNIDRMASEGLRFTQALAGSSVCAPTRCVLMTGLHSGHTSIRNNGAAISIRPEEPTIASVLKAKGYATGGFGKWGCGGRGSTGVPEKHGFDEFVGYYDQTHAHTYYPPYLIRNSVEVPLAGNTGKDGGQTYSHYEIVNEAKSFIRSHREQPFFCYLPITPPHGAFSIPDSDPAWKLYEDKPWPEPARRYAAMVTMVDRQVGEIIELLQELKLDEKTILWFSGDNGGNDYFRDEEHPRGFHAPNVDPRTGVAFRGKKGQLYEGGLRIPMIARWPGHIEPGRVSHLVWYFPDLLPTLAEFAGAETPENVDGMSIVPELLGEAAAKRTQPQHEFLYWEIASRVAVRMGDWKAVRPSRDTAWELYDLKSDVSETEDLAAKSPEVLKRMQRYAAQAHTPIEPGTFAHREGHLRDRAAKSGGQIATPAQRGRASRKTKAPEGEGR